MGGFVVESTAFKRFVQFDGSPPKVTNRRSRRVPPVFVERDIAFRTGEKSIAFAVQFQPAK